MQYFVSVGKGNAHLSLGRFHDFLLDTFGSLGQYDTISDQETRPTLNPPVSKAKITLVLP
jgi:hypothetical protein